jgi:hypothetical protein
MEWVTKLVNKDVLGQGQLLTLLRFGGHSLAMISENIRRPAVEVKHPTARPTIGIVPDHVMASSRPR